MLFCCLSLLLFAAANAQVTTTQLLEKVEPGANPLTIPYEKWKLPNGLTLIVHEDHSDPIVSVNVSYHVGSAREDLGKSGFAHFFEHMMFGGSEHLKDKEHFRIVSESGGNMNGFTQRDKTTYFEIMPSNYLETALWMEADRMGFLLDSVTKQKFEIQRATVKNEKGQNVENQPYAIAFVEVINEILYPAGHPYSWSTIGYVDDLNRVSVDDLKNFFLRWYGPNNAIVTVAGDVNPKDVLAMTEKYFGAIPQCPEVKKMKVPVPILANDQYANYVDNVYLPLTLMVYPTVPAYHRDEAALNLMGMMMGDGNNSIFYKNFVKTEKAIEASTSHGSNELAGEYQIVVVTYPEYDFESIDPNSSKEEIKKKMQEMIMAGFNETEKQIHQTINKFGDSCITADALNRAKAKMTSSIIDQSSGVLQKGMALSDWHMYVGRPYNFSDELDRYNKVTQEDITRVFNKYLKDKHAAIVNVYPKDPESKDSVKSINPNANKKFTDNPEYAGLKYVKAKDSFDRSVKPAAKAPKLPVVPGYFTQQFKNGMKAIGTQSSETPKVVLYFNIQGGNLVLSGDPKKVGLAELTAAMMNEGTANYTTEQVSAELEKLGSDITFSGGGESSTIVVNCLTKNLDATMKILEEKLLNPKFDAADFKRVKKQMVESLVNDKKQADITASKLFDNLIYGNNILGTYVTDKNVKKLTLDDVKNYYKQYYSPSVTDVVIVSELPESEIMGKLAFLEKWTGKEVKMPVVSGFPVIPQTQIYLSHKDDAAQSVINVGQLGMKYDATGEYFKANAMNFSLGGTFNSRLNLNLREDKGYTYGIRSAFSGTTYPGFFEVSASVRRTATDSCLIEIMKELKNYTANGLNDDEVAFTKNSLLNSEALRYEIPFQKAGFLSRIIEYDLPKNFKDEQAKVLQGMSKTDMNAMAKKYIDPDKMVILVVGNKYLIKDKLEKLGYGKVKEVDLQ